jgi:hypothetical protein
VDSIIVNLIVSAFGIALSQSVAVIALFSRKTTADTV